MSPPAASMSRADSSAFMPTLNTTFKKIANGACNRLERLGVTVSVMTDDYMRMLAAARALHPNSDLATKPASLARYLNVSQQTLKHWETRGISGRQVVRVAQLLGCRPEWLTDGRGAMVEVSVGHIKPHADPAARRDILHDHRGNSGGISLSRNGMYVDPATHSALLDEGTITVPVIILAQRGGESAQTPDGTVIDNINLGRAWVRRNLPKISHTDNLVIASHYDDSMSGTFEDGDLLLIDRGVLEYQAPAVYVVQIGDDVDIRRVQRMPDRRLLVKPDNDMYQPATVDEGAVTFMGRVVWAWSGKKL